MELSRLSCCSVVVSSRPPPPPPEHTEEELSTANPSASSTSLSIRSLETKKCHWVCFFFSILLKQSNKDRHSVSFHLRYSRIVAELFLPEPILLHKEVKALWLFPHVIKCHTLCYCSCCDLRGEEGDRVYKTLYTFLFAYTCKRNHKFTLTLCFWMRWKFLSYIWRACSKFLHSSSDHGGDFSAMKPWIHFNNGCAKVTTGHVETKTCPTNKIQPNWIVHYSKLSINHLGITGIYI